jgi:hypothetical protein
VLFIFLMVSQSCAGGITGKVTPSVHESDGTVSSPGRFADHTVIDQFESIDSSSIQDASQIKLLVKHASTGGRISQVGLDFLQGTRDQEGGPSPYPLYKYDRRNWNWQEWRYDGLNRQRNLLERVIDKVAGENAMSRIKMKEFTPDVDLAYQDYDMMGMKFCYLDWKGLNWKYYTDMMLRLEAKYSETRFFWTTAALQHTWDAPESPAGAYQSISSFNEKIREYARTHQKPLYDIADIESHLDDGSLCTDTSGRVVLCPVYYSDDLGHPNQEGSVRLAKGFWWLVASMGGKYVTQLPME